MLTSLSWVTLQDVFFIWREVNYIDSPVLDLATLGHCNHSILSYGTFGAWSALLAGGKAIAATGFTRDGRGDHIEAENLPANWTLMQDPCIDAKSLTVIC